MTDAVRDGRKGIFFTLECTEQETRERIRSLEGKTSGIGDALEIVTSDDICADYINRHLGDAFVGRSPLSTICKFWINGEARLSFPSK